MQDDGRSLTDTRNRLPLFALPEFVLFPHTLVPFHVFEPRYCAMLDACLSGRRLMVVAGLRPGWEDGPEDAAAVHEMAGLGRILSDRRFRDGRYNIFVHCIARVRIQRMQASAPYQVVDVAHVPDEPVDRVALSAAYQRVMSLASGLAVAQGPEGAALSKILASTEDPGALTNRLAAMVVEEATERQALLEILSPLTRCERLAEQVASELMVTAEPAQAGADWVN